jgi:membrane protein implicated in regulation of membrane protease activity
MNRIKGNYIWWSIAHISAGILIALLRYLWVNELVTILLIALLPLVLFREWFRRGHKPDEREQQLLLKVLSYSGATALVIVTALNENLNSHWVYAIWSITLITRGGFGLFYFSRE